MSEPRGVEARIDWFLTNTPSGRGMCAQHTWHALGGDYGNPPAWGCPDANACVDKVRASGRYWTPDTWAGPPPRGAWVGYKYGDDGHACLSLGDGRIATTDPADGAMTGIEDLDYPNRWGASGWDVWTDQYNNVRIEVDDGMTNNLDYKYLGKPAGTLTVGTTYTKLDDSTYDPPRSGWENTLIYLNIRPTRWQPGATIGAVRVRIIRADGDATGYEDFVIAAPALEDGTTLRTYTYWELGDGQKTHVELRCQGGLETADIGTRYVKKAIVVD